MRIGTWIGGLILLGMVGQGLVERAGQITHPAIREASGVVASRRFPGRYWVHNDSGNPPDLFAIEGDGTLVRTFRVSVPNVDWEDIALDQAGHLYLGDIGNNGGRLPVRGIYRLDEPDPARAADGPLPVTRAFFYDFPKRGRFDAEGLFIDGDRAVLVAKTFDGREAELYALPLNRPAPLLRPAQPKRIGNLPGFNEPVTGADLSADGRRLAVGSYQVARVYERDLGGPWRLFSQVHFPKRDFEAICWAGPDLLLIGEKGRMIRISEATWRAGRVR